MKKKINVLGVCVDSITAKEALRACVTFWESDCLNIVEILSEDVLVKSDITDKMIENIKTADLVLAGDKAILVAAGISDEKKLKEAERGTFIKLFLHLLRRENRRLFLVADTSEELQSFREKIEDIKGIQVVGMAVVPEDDSQDDNIVNEINGLEVDCVLSQLSLSKQEAIVLRNRGRISANMWVRIGKSILENEKKGIRKSLSYLCKKHFALKEIRRENQ